jgi:hypothetical protein
MLAIYRYTPWSSTGGMMPRYFFNIEDHIRDEDNHGTDMANAAEAR